MRSPKRIPSSRRSGIRIIPRKSITCITSTIFLPVGRRKSKSLLTTVIVCVKIQKNDRLSAEISDLANEKYVFADEKTDENLQNVNLENETSSQSDENLEDKNEFVNLEFENQNLEFQSEDLQTTTQNLQTQNGQIEEFKKELNDILLKFKNYKEDETEFLKALKERVVVLFEGLNAFEGDLEARVELSIKFMEFLLASIDNRVENLSK